MVKNLLYSFPSLTKNWWYNELFNNNSRLGLPARMVADVPAPQPIWDLEEVCRAKNI